MSTSLTATSPAKTQERPYSTHPGSPGVLWVPAYWPSASLVRTVCALGDDVLDAEAGPEEPGPELPPPTSSAARTAKS